MRVGTGPGCGEGGGLAEEAAAPFRGSGRRGTLSRAPTAGCNRSEAHERPVYAGLQSLNSSCACLNIVCRVLMSVSVFSQTTIGVLSADNAPRWQSRQTRSPLPRGLPAAGWSSRRTGVGGARLTGTRLSSSMTSGEPPTCPQRTTHRFPGNHPPISRNHLGNHLGNHLDLRWFRSERLAGWGAAEVVTTYGTRARSRLDAGRRPFHDRSGLFHATSWHLIDLNPPQANHPAVPSEPPIASPGTTHRYPGTTSGTTSGTT